MNRFPPQIVNTVITGDCLEVLQGFPSGSVDFVLSDPPYLIGYCPRDGRRIINDESIAWLRPAFQEIHRVLRQDAFCVTFYGWPHADLFVSAFREAGFRPVSHLCFVKDYPSYVGYTRAEHETAYLLAKGRPPKGVWRYRLSDVRPWEYTGNKLHPTQKPVSALIPLIEAFSKPGDVVLDPFCGSGSSLVAAEMTHRNFIGVEIDPCQARRARGRLNPLEKISGAKSAK